MTPPDRPVSVRLEELRRLRAAATDGPWRTGTEPALRDGVWSETAATFEDDDHEYSSLVAWCHSDYRNDDDAALIVAAVNALPALLDIAEAAEDTIGRHEGCFGEEHLADCPFGRLEGALDRLNTEDGADPDRG